VGHCGGARQRCGGSGRRGAAVGRGSAAAGNGTGSCSRGGRVGGSAPARLGAACDFLHYLYYLHYSCYLHYLHYLHYSCYLHYSHYSMATGRPRIDTNTFYCIPSQDDIIGWNLQTMLYPVALFWQ
jgi:hypothetical protein